MGDDTIETAINIDTRSVCFKSHNEKEIDQIIITKSDCPTQPHNGKKIDCIVVSQDESYAVTYSREDGSIQGWSINVEEKQQKPDDVYFKFKQPYKVGFVLCKRMLLFYYYDDKEKFQQRLINIDFSGGKDRIQTLQLKHAEKISTDQRWMGFFPNGDLIVVSLDKKLKDYKIYLYSSINKPTDVDATLWEYSQIYSIEFHESLSEHNYIGCYMHQKLFLFNEGHLTQWDLNLDLDLITFETQYSLFSENVQNIVINKNQTLLASYDEINDINEINIYSMETGIHISRHDYENYYPTNFVTSKDGFEGLIILAYDDNEKCFYKFLHPSGEIDITDDITNNIGNRNKIFITKSNKQLYIENNHVLVTDGMNEDRFLNKTYHSNIYTLPIFKAIQNMLKDIINDKVCYSFPERNKIELTDGEHFRFNLERLERGYGDEVKVTGLIQNNNKLEETQSSCVSSGKLVSYKKLNNQALALITTAGIYIYTIVEDLRLRYFWNNEKLDVYYDSNDDDDGLIDYKIIIQEILDDKFKDSLSSPSSLPPPNFEICSSYAEYHDLVLGIINDQEDFPKFILEILNIAIKVINEASKREVRKSGDKIIKLIFGKIIDLIEKEDYSLYMKLLPAISLNLPKLCNDHYSNLEVTKYILHTLILLDPSCSSIKNLTNTSLYAYSKDIYVKKSILSNNNYFKSLFLSFYKILSHHLKMQKILISSFYHKLRSPKIQIPTISFIVPFPQICNYYEKEKNYNPWNEILFQPKSILFCNIDNNNFYKWWNFAAIIDFKWKTFGKFYYFLIWFFYAIFFICFAIATTLDLTEFYHKIFFIISILFGFAHLFFEFQQFLWKPRYYIKDPWNLFDVGAYSLPIITSIYWLINGPSLPIAAISILLLNFKFLLFFRVFQSYGKYFAIIVGVAEEVFPFLVVLCFIIFGFGSSFFILLKSTDFSLDHPAFNDDKNNPWNLATKYNSINPDGTINPDATLIQTPDLNTNMFSWFSTSILAMYLFLTGDSGSLSSWTYLEDPMMTILLFLFTFTTVIYLMNLFIGLLNMSIDKYNKHEEFLLSVARILIEIELFYMLPYQRHKKEWFPDWIYYHMPIDEVYKLINAIDNNKTVFYSLPFISNELRKLIGIPEHTDNIKDEFKQIKHELKQKKGEFKQTEDEFKQTKDELTDNIKGEFKQTKDELKQTKDELEQIKDEFKQTKDELEQIKDEFKQTKDELKQTKDELKQEFKDVKKLLNSLIKNLNIDSNDI